MSLLILQNISRRYDSTPAVKDISLEVERGEFFGLLGPSGCGKTTTLRMIAGLEKPDAGRLTLTVAISPVRRLKRAALAWSFRTTLSFRI